MTHIVIQVTGGKHKHYINGGGGARNNIGKWFACNGNIKRSINKINKHRASLQYLPRVPLQGFSDYAH